MNLLELPVSELKSALIGFNKVVNIKSALPALGCLRIEPQGEDVHLQVTDLDSFATCRLKASASPEFPVCLVSLATLAKVVKTAKGGIVLIQEGKDRFKIRHCIGTTPVEQPIETWPIEDWPPVPQLQARQFLVEPRFKEAFHQALECASIQSTRLILSGVCLDLSQPDCHCLVASDGRHLFSANSFQFPLTDSLVIPERNFLRWPGFAEDGDWLLTVEPAINQAGQAQRPACVQIQSQRWTFLTRGLDGPYPNWRQVMPSPDRTCTTVKLADEAVGLILDALPRMPGTDDSSQPVTIIIRSGHLLLRSRPPLGNEWTEVPVCGVSVKGADQRVCLNRTFITKALRFGFTEFEVQDALSPVLFTGPGKKLIAMPLQLNDAPVTAQPDNQTKAPSPQPSPQEAATPTEVAPAVPRPPLESDHPTDQTTAMTTNNITSMPAPVRGNLKPAILNGNNGDASKAFKAVVDQVEKIKTNLRDVISDLSETLDLLKAAEKEKRATLKEVESVRATLRSLQKMEL